MKKYLPLFAVATLGVTAYAQDAEDLEVKNASSVNQLANYDDGIAKSWELRIDGGAAWGGHKGSDHGPTKRDEGLMFDLGLGYNLNNNLYLGVSSGFWPKMGSVLCSEDANMLIPALADLTYRWKLNTGEKWSFFIQVRGGYLFGLHDDETIKNKTTEVNGYYYADFNPGIYYRIGHRTELKFSVGYGYMLAREGDADPCLTQNQNMLNARIGLNFR